MRVRNYLLRLSLLLIAASAAMFGMYNTAPNTDLRVTSVVAFAVFGGLAIIWVFGGLTALDDLGVGDE